MPRFDKVITLVIDSGGVGEMSDAADYGDVGSNTLANVAAHVGGLNLPNLTRLGLGCLTEIQGVPPQEAPTASFGRMAGASPGKDTTTGHWEMVGIVLDTPLPIFPDGFTEDVLAPFRERTGLGVLGNRAASGTEIIKELGEEHQRTGDPIVYTSADSVFQVAAHVDTIALERLYEICEIAREIVDEIGLSRVIARPFAGEPGSYYRTQDRRDYALPPPQRSVLQELADAGVPVVGVGKIKDIFHGVGITRSVKAKDNESIANATVDLIRNQDRGFIFSNFVDFDMLYGHRNDPDGYASALEAFDRRLGEMLALLTPNDLLLITADHGCDPTITSSTDHTREFVPILAHTPAQTRGVDLGVRKTFADLGQTLADNFGVSALAHGTSFLNDISA